MLFSKSNLTHNTSEPSNNAFKPKASDKVPVPTRKVILAPKKLCLASLELVEDTIVFFNNIGAQPSHKLNSVIIDLSELEFISSPAATYLFSIVTAMQIYVSHNYFIIKSSKNDAIKEFFTRSGLHDSLRKGGEPKLEKLWGFSQFIAGNNNEVKRFLELIKERIELKQLPAKLSTAMRETLLNVNHHAYGGPSSLVNITWWCFFYYGEDDKGKYLIATIVDRGIGIPYKIRKAFPHESLGFEDGDCISYAMKESISSTKENGRGKGSVNI